MQYMHRVMEISSSEYFPKQLIQVTHNNMHLRSSAFATSAHGTKTLYQKTKRHRPHAAHVASEMHTSTCNSKSGLRTNRQALLPHSSLLFVQGTTPTALANLLFMAGGFWQITYVNEGNRHQSWVMLGTLVKNHKKNNARSVDVRSE